MTMEEIKDMVNIKRHELTLKRHELTLKRHELTLIRSSLRSIEESINLLYHDYITGIDNHCLTERDIEILRLKFKEKKTFHAIASIIGLTPERVRQLMLKAIDKIEMIIIK